MGYDLCAFIAKPKVLEVIKPLSTLLKVITIEQGFALMPLPYNVLNSIPGYKSPDKVEGFEYLNRRVTEIGSDGSKHGALAYVEVSFFGGIGGQAAVAWENGAVIFGPTHKQGIGPVNGALKAIGMEHTLDQYDYFESAGLMRYRDTAYWYENAT
jgi:hypothetical protein